MHRTPLAATIVLAAVLGALVAGAGAALAAPTAHPEFASNRGWERPGPVADLPH